MRGRISDQPLLVPLQGREQARHFEPERNRHSLLQIATPGHWRIPMIPGEFGRRDDRRVQLLTDHLNDLRICMMVAVSVISCVVAPQWQ